MAYPNSIFNISLLEELDRFLPDVLYNSDRFQSVQDLLGYIQGQARAQCPNFEARRTLYRQYLDVSGTIQPAVTEPTIASQATATASQATATTTSTPIIDDISSDEIPVTPRRNRYSDMSFLNELMNLAMPLAPVRPYTTSSRLGNLLFTTTASSNLIFEQDDYGGLINSLFGPMEDVIVAPSTEQIRLATTVSNTPMDDNCAICQEEVLSDSEIRTINQCNHAFHKGCIDQWLERSVFCPICRIDIRS
uniref:RING-type domain-containing protein n=1 Tax=viral metagenome TaxID=1070528 RepID=A0A6C0DJE3_9ZZZZ